ncbi:restriction endonuclease subunit S [Levilactobacillus spicheri]|uniref:restriction endonuclease subunit S n=1 Tax=Levilactobacillus spicheri TaxID=216463 RepID=UPI001CDAFABC|nr:restriction endonuclease subunit S [Levilactobacillus spicheri]
MYDWEQRKLGEISEIKRGASPRPIKDKKWFSDTSEVGWLRISDVTSQNGRVSHVAQHLSKAGQEKTLVLNEPHLILSIAASVGKPVINYLRTGIHDGFIVFVHPKFELEFMFQWLESYQDKWQRFGQPGSQVNLNSELVRNLEISIPDKNEQLRISQVLRYIDTIIASNQRAPFPTISPPKTNV